MSTCINTDHDKAHCWETQTPKEDWCEPCLIEYAYKLEDQIANLKANLENLEWEPGQLGTHQLESILTYTIADLWRDAWRQEQPKTERMQRFKRIIEANLYAATGEDLAITER